jgi:hypothetical protein
MGTTTLTFFEKEKRPNLTDERKTKFKELLISQMDEKLNSKKHLMKTCFRTSLTSKSVKCANMTK